ncbi:hypothetical protein K7G98_11825 [Saccharothrix sp. MB29]|nr:hypothetical protein [Saccharothrix sp. MB29]
MAERKSVLLRLDPAVHDALSRWASDELRSTNAQIEFLLRRALAEAGRRPTPPAPPPPPGPPPPPARGGGRPPPPPRPAPPPARWRAGATPRRAGSASTGASTARCRARSPRPARAAARTA